MKEERQKDFMVNPSNCHSTKKETNSYAFNFMILTIDFTDSLLLSLNLWIRFHMNRHNCYTVNTDRIYILLIYQYLYAYIHVVSELAHKQSYYFIFSSFFGCGGVEVVLLMIFKSIITIIDITVAITPSSLGLMVGKKVAITTNKKQKVIKFRIKISIKLV